MKLFTKACIYICFAQYDIYTRKIDIIPIEIFGRMCPHAFFSVSMYILCSRVCVCSCKCVSRLYWCVVCRQKSVHRHITYSYVHDS